MNLLFPRELRKSLPLLRRNCMHVWLCTGMTRFKSLPGAQDGQTQLLCSPQPAEIMGETLIPPFLHLSFARWVLWQAKVVKCSIILELQHSLNSQDGRRTSESLTQSSKKQKIQEQFCMERQWLLPTPSSVELM